MNHTVYVRLALRSTPPRNIRPQGMYPAPRSPQKSGSNQSRICQTSPAENKEQ